MQDAAYDGLEMLRIERSDDLVYQSLRRAIISGLFTPGQRLIETRLGERFGVSRAPVREALRMLESEGLIQSTPRRGVFVASLDRSDAAEVYGLRTALECWAAREACGKASKEDVEELGRLIHAMENAAEARAVHELVREDVVFHRKICEIAANRRLLRTWIGVIGQIHLLSRHVIETLYEDLHIIAQRHDLIREAILGGNEDVAERVVRDHIDSVARRVLLTL